MASETVACRTLPLGAELARRSVSGFGAHHIRTRGNWSHCKPDLGLGGGAERPVQTAAASDPGVATTIFQSGSRNSCEHASSALTTSCRNARRYTSRLNATTLSTGYQ